MASPNVGKQSWLSLTSTKYDMYTRESVEGKTFNGNNMWLHKDGEVLIIIKTTESGLWKQNKDAQDIFLHIIDQM